MHKSLIILAILGIGGALYLGSAVLVPVVLALFGAMLLMPLAELFCRWGLSRIASAGCVMLALAATIGLLVNLTLDPAREWIERAPTVLREIESKIRPLRQAAGELDRMAEHAERIAGSPSATSGAAAVASPSAGGGVLSWTMGVIVPVIGTFFMIFFVLAFGPPILQAMAAGCRSDGTARHLIAAAERVRREMGRYLGTLAVINSALGVATAAICVFFDLPSPVLWGVMAAVFNFIPYAGSTTTLIVITTVALLTHNLSTALGVAVSYLIVDTIEGQVVQPLAIGKRLSLNPLAIFLALWIGAGLWGLAGLLLATPVLLTVRIVCRRIPSCRMLNHFLAPVRERPLINRARAWRRKQRRKHAASRLKKARVSAPA